ncbi:MAG: sugar phosphate nucleotidyltransferase [Candidatus Dojkabacteria bacterium]|nr:sugar phosphate nucleotidyltransferase [Candidatus Dojkabacteria bacterium]
MKVVIFAGGFGKRLWPLSRKSIPKQFHKIYEDMTTLEHAYWPLAKKYGIENIYISTTKDYYDHIKGIIKNVSDSNLILEPSSRDNGPAVAYAMNYLYKKFPEDKILIRWQNSIIQNEQIFLFMLDKAEESFDQHKLDLVYFAVPIKFPSTNVGYIKVSEKLFSFGEDISVYKFESFIEKPSIDKAIEYFSNSKVYFWNPGTYITTPKFILENLSVTSPSIFNLIQRINEVSDEKEILRLYNLMPRISIDYALWEKLPNNNIHVFVSDYGWYYLSTWTDLKIALLNKQKGSTSFCKGLVELSDSSNNLILNYVKNKLVCLVGINNVNVINTEDVLLVVHDSKSAEIKKIYDMLDEKYNQKYTN